MSTQPILNNGRWRAAQASGAFHAENPATGETLPDAYPISDFTDCDAALEAASHAATALGETPPENLAMFLEDYAQRIEARAGELCATAHLETGYPVSPRLADVELPRTAGQLRQAAAAARLRAYFPYCTFSILPSLASLASKTAPASRRNSTTVAS